LSAYQLVLNDVHIFGNCSLKALFHLSFKLKLEFQHFGIAIAGCYASVYSIPIAGLAKFEVLPK
jgi:hypothetical protein